MHYVGHAFTDTLILPHGSHLPSRRTLRPRNPNGGFGDDQAIFAGGKAKARHDTE